MEKEPTEIAAIWLKKAQKEGFFSPDKREYHTSKCNGKNKKKEQGERKEEKGEKATFVLLWMKKKTVTLSKIRLEMYLAHNLFQSRTNSLCIVQWKEIAPAISSWILDVLSASHLYACLVDRRRREGRKSLYPPQKRLEIL